MGWKLTLPLRAFPGVWALVRVGFLRTRYYWERGSEHLTLYDGGQAFCGTTKPSSLACISYYRDADNEPSELLACICAKDIVEEGARLEIAVKEWKMSLLDTVKTFLKGTRRVALYTENMKPPPTLKRSMKCVSFENITFCVHEKLVADGLAIGLLANILSARENLQALIPLAARLIAHHADTPHNPMPIAYQRGIYGEDEIIDIEDIVEEGDTIEAIYNLVPTTYILYIKE